MLAYDYPLLGIFWTILMVFLWVAWLLLLFRVFADIFRSKDIGGVAKAIWSIFVIVLPFLGTLVYILVRGHGMTDRDIAQATAQREAFDTYVRQASGGGGAADELSKLAALKDQGVITEAEFAAQKAKLLA